MHATVNPLRCLPLLATWLVCLAVAAAEACGDEVVRMEPYYVDGSVSDLRLRVRHDPATKKITVMQIVRVGPSLEKSGIRVGDRVTAINDKTVSAMTVGEFEALTGPRDVAEQRLRFSVKRGFLRKQIDIPLVFRKRKKPASPPASSLPERPAATQPLQP